MASQKKRIDRKISKVNVKEGSMMEKFEGHLPSIEAQLKKLPSESSFTDSSMIIINPIEFHTCFNLLI